ncbi:hypothetical protein J6590_087651 [Homalodisca vitripennis]|nr:hypothetical protein J6590_087651 [Homalodisca vitripennis]
MCYHYTTETSRFTRQVRDPGSSSGGANHNSESVVRPSKKVYIHNSGNKRVRVPHCKTTTQSLWLDRVKRFIYTTAVTVEYEYHVVNWNVCRVSSLTDCPTTTRGLQLDRVNRFIYTTAVTDEYEYYVVN